MSFFKKLHQQSEKGFTLIEIIVVFSVIGILSGVGITSYVSYSRSSQLTQEASNLVEALTLAKSRALSQVKPKECVGSQALSGYKFKISAAEEYEVWGVCKAGSAEFEYPTMKDELSMPVVFSESTSVEDVFFPILKGGAIINNGALSEGEIIIEAYGQERCVKVAKAGAIETGC